MLVGLHLRSASAARDSLWCRAQDSVVVSTPASTTRTSVSGALYFKAHERSRLTVLDDTAQCLYGSDCYSHLAVPQRSCKDIYDS